MTTETPGPAPEQSKEPLSAYLKLPIRHRRFVDGLMEGKTGAQAARDAGCTALDSKAWACKVRARPEVKAAIDECRALQLEEFKDRQKILLDGIHARANADRMAIFDPTTRALRPVHEWPDEVRATIESLEFDDKGQLSKVRTSSRNEASKLQAQISKLITERHEVTGRDGAALPAGPTFVIAREEAKQIGRDLDEKI
jgi:phage terminase small subunit